MPVTCKILSSPDRNAEVRFDFNPGFQEGSWLHDRNDGFDLGEPEFTVAYDGSLVEGTRSLKMSYINARSRAEAESALGACARAVMVTSDNWLMWQLDQYSTPTFFRLHPSKPGGLDFRWVDAFSDDHRIWRWDITLEADAFSYGERRSYQTTVTYGLEGSSFKIPEPTGDVPTRARVEVTPTSTGTDPEGWPVTLSDMIGCTPMVSMSSFPVGALPEEGILRWESEYFTARAGYLRYETALTSGSRLSELPGRGFGIECPNASNTGFSGSLCMSGTAPNKVPPGAYRVMLRIVNPSTTTPVRPSFRVQAQGWGASASTYWTTWQCPTASGPSSAFAYGSWLDCGELQVPVGVDPTNLDINDIERPDISIYHRGDGNAGRVIIDQIMMVPTDPVNGEASTLMIGWLNGTGPSVFGPMVVDDQSYRVGNFDELSDPGNSKWRSEGAPRVFGGYPYLAPQKDNFFTFLWNVQRENPSQNLKTFDPHEMELSVKVSWNPRYLHLGSL